MTIAAWRLRALPPLVALRPETLTAGSGGGGGAAAIVCSPLWTLLTHAVGVALWTRWRRWLGAGDDGAGKGAREVPCEQIVCLSRLDGALHGARASQTSLCGPC